jgi:hypothetical protein
MCCALVQTVYTELVSLVDKCHPNVRPMMQVQDFHAWSPAVPLRAHVGTRAQCRARSFAVMSYASG